MNRTWSQATALVRANFQLLAIIAGVFMLLPGVMIYMAMPDLFSQMALAQDPEQISALLASMAGPLTLFFLISFVLQMIGYGAMVALMGEDRPTVGEALRRGARSLPTLIGTALVVLVVYLLLSFALGLVMMLLVGLVGAIGGQAAAAVITFVLLLILGIIVLYVMTRLSLTLAVVVLERQLNPVRALIRSWHITKDHAWSIFGFYVLLLIAYFVISLLLMGILGVVGAALGEGAASAFFMGIVNGLIGAFVAMVMSGILVSMHQQLAGRSAAEIGETFS
jgi:uncharacterized membrane protein YjjP (DUF1212 family)